MSPTMSGPESIGAGASAVKPRPRGEGGLADTPNKPPAPTPSIGVQLVIRVDDDSLWREIGDEWMRATPALRKKLRKVLTDILDRHGISWEAE